LIGLFFSLILPKNFKLALTYQTLEVIAKKHETTDAVTITFKTKGNDTFKYLPGQYLTISFIINGERINRSYSICTSPYKNENLSITVKKVEGGKVSTILVNNTKVGDILEVLPPTGKFVFEPFSDRKRNLLLFAAGSGITPILSIIRSTLEVETSTKIILFYGSRNENEIISKADLDDLCALTQGRIRVIYTLSQPSLSWTGEKGRLDERKVDYFLDVFSVYKQDNWLAYMCGPGGMMDSAERILLNRGFDINNIHRESFFNAKENDHINEPINPVVFSRKVKVTINKKTHEIIVDKKQNILDAAMPLDPPFSCVSGVCTTCMAKVIKGKVDMIDNASLTDDEIEQGYILTCQAIPMSDDVEITYDY